jgi:hypothetical protein
MGGGGDFSNLYEYFFKYNPLHEFFLCQLIISPIEKSLHEFFFSNFFGARIFFSLSVSPARFYFCFFPTPPITFLMVRPLLALPVTLGFHIWSFPTYADGVEVPKSSASCNRFIPILQNGKSPRSSLFL